MKNKQKWYSMILISSILATTISTPVYAISEAGKTPEESISPVTNEASKVSEELEKSLLLKENGNEAEIVSDSSIVDTTVEEVHKEKIETTIPVENDEIFTEEKKSEMIIPDELNPTDSSMSSEENLNKEETNTTQKAVTESEKNIDEQNNLINEDEDGPLIDLSSLEISKKEATVGENVTISITVEGENEVEGVNVSYLMPLSGNYESFNLEFNEKTGKYETEITIDEYRESGIWQIESISAYDKLNNSTYIYNDQLTEYGEEDLSRGNITIIGGKEDINGPIIDLSSLEISKKEATVGENVTISIKVEDENEVAQLYVYYTSQLSGSQKLFVMEYNTETSMFEKEINNDEYTESGLWQIDSIEAVDKLKNSTRISNTQINDSGDEDLSAGDYTVIGGKDDIVGPVIEVSSLKISQKEAEIGETIKISLKVEDKNDISDVYVSYLSPLTGELEGFSLDFNEKTGNFVTEIIVNKFMESGTWQMTGISAYDSFGNESYIYSTQTDDSGDEDLSAGDFTVIGGKEDFTGPVIDASSLKISQKETTVGDIVTISMKSDDKSNVEGMTITYFSPITKSHENYSMKFNKESGFFESEIEINKYSESGIWKIESIGARDSLYNTTWIINDQLNEEGYEDLIAGQFTVTGGKVDVISPNIDEGTLTSNIKKATIGEEVKISVKAEDKSGVEGVYVNYEMPISSRVHRLKLNYNKDTGYYEGFIKIDKTSESGKWKVISIQAYDTYNNVNNLYNDNYDEFYNGTDLTAAEFTVSGASEVETRPTYEVSDISVDLKEVAIGDKIKVSVKLPTDVMITMATIYYISPNSDEPTVVELKYNKDTERYEGYYEVTKDSTTGLQKIQIIGYADILNNQVYIESININPENGLDLSNGNFKILDEISLQSISMNKKKLTLKKNNNETLKVEYTPSNTTVNKQIKWTSSDSRIATVDEKGEVKAISSGTVIVTADVNGKKTSSTVTISAPSVSYSTHVQSYGWMSEVKDGKLAGTEGKRKRMEAIKVSVENNPDLGITYSTHVEKNGWMNWVSDGNLSGTSGEAKRLEAIKLKLTGTDAEKYDVYYRVHAEKNGWLGWAKNGEEAGTEGFGRRLEAIEIVIVEKGAAAPGSTTDAFVKKEIIPTVSYTTHVQSIGWQSWVKDGKMAGTSGKAKRLEGIKLKLENLPYAGGVQYKTHVQSYGWQGWSTNSALSGTSGKAKRLEAIQIQLTGEMAKKYDVYYRVHAQSYGWLGWAKNGESSGSEGKSKRLEGVEIKLVKKGEQTPVSTVKSFIK